MKAPDSCPICGEIDHWKPVYNQQKGFDITEAILGNMLLGEGGWLLGFLGKNKSIYQCDKCGYRCEYETMADKDCCATSLEGFKREGLYKHYIDIMEKATPNCVFCGKPQKLYVKGNGLGYLFVCSNCRALFKCDFTFDGKIKSNSTQILNVGMLNLNNLKTGNCNAEVLVKDASKIIKQ